MGAWIGDDNLLPNLMEESDFVVLCVPLTNTTKGMINSSMIARMRQTAVIINPARGPVVDESALYEALKLNLIGGAVLDSWWHDFAWLNSTTLGKDGWPAKHNFSGL